MMHKYKTLNLDFNPNITIPKLNTIFIDLDCDYFEDIEIFSIKKEGKTLSFPMWEFLKIIEKGQ